MPRLNRSLDTFQEVPGVPDLQEGLNPATWMLQISSPGMEASLELDFADVYHNSEQFRCTPSFYAPPPIIVIHNMKDDQFCALVALRGVPKF